MIRTLCGLALLFVGCGGGAVNHERLGDGHYTQGEFARALAEYRTAQRSAPTARVWAKLGAAALRTGDYPEAIDAYRQLAAADPTRQQEAARGLERVIRAASRPGAGGSALVAQAIAAIRRAAPDRPLSRTALGPSGLADLAVDEAVTVLPAALGATDRAGEVDRLLVDYGRALEATTACDGATRAFRTALRRSTDERLRRVARDGVAGCALRLGLDALAADQPAEAEDWFATALQADTTGVVSARARIALGEARLRQGDVLGAAIWWQLVLGTPNVPDSLSRLAAERLNSLASAGPPEDDS